MSWADSVAASGLTAGLSPFDTRRFGFSVGRIVVPCGASTTTPADVVAAVADIAAEVTIVRYPAANTSWFAELMRDHEVLLADSLVYWRLPVSSASAPTPPGNLTTNSTPKPELVDRLVDDIFAGYRSHYSANPRFDAELALAGYREWARRSAAEGGAVVLLEGTSQVGLATTEVDRGVLEILLAGVVPERQGQGLYAQLLAAVEQHAATRGATGVVISTQVHNTNVQRAWARYGFEPMASLVTVHVMPRSLR